MSQKNRLTPSQELILSFIRSRCRNFGNPPSYREIQNHFGYRAVGTVQDHVRALRKKGFVETPPPNRPARGLIPVGMASSGGKTISIFGEIAAGAAREAPQVEIGTLYVSEDEVRDPCFALRVVGDSMCEVGILEGDFLVVERGVPIRSGDIVVALLNGETTVKRYVQHSDGSEISLVPENRAMKPILVRDGNFEIQGKVVGLQRRF